MTGDRQRPKSAWLFHEPVQVPSQADHPLVRGDTVGATDEAEALRLIHLKAYSDAATLSTGRTVLDIGCNEGYGTVLLARDARRVVGVDVAPKAISAARTRADAAGVEFKLIDGTDLPFADATFDLVTAFQVIEHIADVKPFLEEARRVTCPGGTVVFTTPNAAIRLDPGMRPWNPFHQREYTAKELAEELGAVFTTVIVRGLFAPAPIAAIELARASAARRRARRPEPRPARVLKSLLPDRAKAMLRRLVRGRPGDPASIRGFTVDDLWLGDADLDDSLDLQAICAIEPPAVRGQVDGP